MQFSNVKDIFKDWVKSGFRFGNTFSNYMAAKLEASPAGTRIGGGIFDLAAGGGITYLAATSALGTIAGAVGAVAAIASAPLTAVVTVAVGVVWLALATGMAGIGLGLLDAARQKAGIARPSSFIRSTRDAVDDATASVKNIFKKDAKSPAKEFKSASVGKKPSASGEKPGVNSDFRF